MACTLKDIARECNVSIYAVSRILNNKPIYLVAEKRELIKKTAKRLHYTPNMLARSLRSDKSNTVGFILCYLSSPFHLNLVRYLEHKLSRENYSMLISSSELQLQDELNQISQMRSRSCEMILVSTRFNITENADRLDEYLEIISQDDKIFFIDSIIPSDKINYATTNNALATRRAISFFIKKGIKHFKFIRTPANLYVTRERYNGFLEACREFNIDFSDKDIFTLSPKEHSNILESLKRVEKNTLFFFEGLGNDFSTFIEYCKELKMRIGEDYFISGFDTPYMDDPFYLLKEYKDIIVRPVPYLLQDKEKFIDAAMAYLKNRSKTQLMIEPEFVNFDKF
jgi:LacI family transcriptional regulator, galactose operon repressor